MQVFEDKRIEERRVRVGVTWEEIEEALRTVVGKKLGLPLSQAKQLTVRLEQMTEGSPPYPIGKWKAEVKGGINLQPEPTEREA